MRPYETTPLWLPSAVWFSHFLLRPGEFLFQLELIQSLATTVPLFGEAQVDPA